MKRFLLFTALIVLSANTVFAQDLDIVENFQKEEYKYILTNCKTEFNKAQSSKLNKDYVVFCKCALKQNTSNLTPESKQIYENVLYKMALIYSAQKYTLTKNKAALNEAINFANKAIKNNTTDTNTLNIAFLLYGENLDINKMSDAYERLCAVNSEKCEQQKNTYNNYLNRITEIKNYKKLVMSQAIKNAGTALQQSAQQSAQIYSQQAAKHTSTSCYTMGNTLHCDTY